MAKAVQSWLQTIKLDESYQTELKMAMAKLQPKRFYWFVTLLVGHSLLHTFFQGENVSFPQIVVQREHSEPLRQLFGEAKGENRLKNENPFSNVFRISTLLINKNDNFAIPMSRRRTIFYTSFSLCYASAKIHA